MGTPRCEFAFSTAALRGQLKWLLRNFQSHVMRPRRIGVPWYLWPMSAYTVCDPRGVVVIISPWNLCLMLALEPLAGALLTGNSVVLKLSEACQHQSRLLAKLLPRYVDRSCLRVVLGGPDVGKAVVGQLVDFVFYTGGPAAGAAIAASCGGRLIPFVLELGGKSPVVVFPDADMTALARRVVQGRCLNAGQICVCGDYLVVVGDEVRRDEVVRAVASEIRRQYGPDPQQSEHFGRLVSRAHVDHVAGLLPRPEDAAQCSCRVAYGGRVDRADKYVEPTLLTVGMEHAGTCRAMCGEIFGPVLPVVAVPDAAAAVRVIRGKDKPLQVYVFTSREENVSYVLRRTTSGGAAVNDVLMGAANLYAKFGTIGFGTYHGPHTFECFGHTRPVNHSSALVDSEYRYPPKIATPAVQRAFDWVF